VRGDHSRVQPYGLLKASFGLGNLSANEMDASQVVVRGGQAGLNADRLAAMIFGVDEVALVGQGTAQIGMGRRQVRLNPQGGAIGTNGLV